MHIIWYNAKKENWTLVFLTLERAWLARKRSLPLSSGTKASSRLIDNHSKHDREKEWEDFISIFYRSLSREGICFGTYWLRTTAKPQSDISNLLPHVAFIIFLGNRALFSIPHCFHQMIISLVNIFPTHIYYFKSGAWMGRKGRTGKVVHLGTKM